MIILTRAEAEYVLGVSPIVGHAALEPAPVPNGEYILPEDVMDDPANEDCADFLASLPTRELTPEDEWVFELEDGTPDEAAQALYESMKLTWHEPESERATVARQARIDEGNTL